MFPTSDLLLLINPNVKAFISPRVNFANPSKANPNAKYTIVFMFLIYDGFIRKCFIKKRIIRINKLINAKSLFKRRIIAIGVDE